MPVGGTGILYRVPLPQLLVRRAFDAPRVPEGNVRSYLSKMAKAKNQQTTGASDDYARLETSAEDTTKANKWFQRARELGDKRQFDYAIEYYVNGLEYWPDAVEEACKPLHGCAVARRQTGGKKPGLKDTMKRSLNDKDARKALINSLWLFGRDPDSLSYLEGIVKNATRLRADNAAKWAANIFLRALESAPKTNPKQCQSLANLVEEVAGRAKQNGEANFAVELLQTGVESLTLWRMRFPKDDAADKALKDMTTKLTILKGRYQDGGSFLDSIQDGAAQMELHDEQRTVQSDDRIKELAAKAEREYRKNPENTDLLRKYVEMLCRRELDEDETKAISLLLGEYKRTDDYRWKILADDIRIKQLSRKRRKIQKSGDADALKQHRIQQLRYELGVFKERTEKYPTDIRFKFEYGVRNFQAGRFDDAIPLFQAARSDPRSRAACSMYLGRCFYRKGYNDQAISTLEDAIKTYDIPDDDLAKTMQYWLARAQEAGSNVEGARKTYGQILQLDYNYADVRKRLDKLPA